MTKLLDEKIEFLQDLDATCEEHRQKYKDNKEMLFFIDEFQSNIQEELQPLEEEQDYYAEKYRPTEADL